jgi:hypothetical protein
MSQTYIEYQENEAKNNRPLILLYACIICERHFSTKPKLKRHYVKAHVDYSSPDAVLSGKRVEIGEQLTARLLERGRDRSPAPRNRGPGRGQPGGAGRTHHRPRAQAVRLDPLQADALYLLFFPRLEVKPSPSRPC